MNGVVDSSSLNKSNKNNFKYMHAYFFYFLYVYIFFFCIFFFFGLGSTQPAQTSDPAGPHEARVIQITHAWPLLINSK